MKSNIQETLAKWLDNLIQPLATLDLVVAYSGGRDSHVLLHALTSLKPLFPSLSISAMHVNHGLQVQATTWATHCVRTAASYGVHCHVIHLQLQPQKGESVEEVAREGRYRAFKSLLKPNQSILTAHTQDDQAETIILQLMRGVGPKGLSGMASMSMLGEGQMRRPLLNVSRSEIEHYALAHELVWVEDPSNQNTRFARNFLRHEVFAPLQSYFPGFVSCVSRSAEHIASMHSLLDEYLSADFAACLLNGGMLDLVVLKGFSTSKHMAILRKWLSHHQIRSPSTAVLTSLLQQAMYAKIDAKVSVTVGQTTISRYQDRLYCYTKHKVEQKDQVEWDLTRPLIWAGKHWQARQVLGKGIVLPLNIQLLTVRWRVGGERCRLVGETMSRSLKKVLQNLQIPFWQRTELPLFYQGDCLVSIGNALICDGWQVTSPDTYGWVIEQVE